MSPKPDVVYVSPHLDDVMLSCPARLVADRAAGRRVLVLTLFSEGRQYHLRRAEDQTAAALLDVDIQHAGLLDAPFRSAVYRDFSSICFGFDNADQATIEAARQHVQAAAFGAELVAPLAVGTHVDHRIAHAAARAVRGAGLVLYEDRPYAQVPGAIEGRLAWARGRPQPNPVAAFAALETAPFARTWLTPADHDRVAQAMAQSCPGPWLPPLGSLTASTLPASPDALQVARCYATQFEALYHNDATFQALQPSVETVYTVD